MIKLDPHIKKLNGKKICFPDSSILNKDRLMRINKGSLLIINKGKLLRNENGYRFHSHHSQVFLTTRTQSTTIPIFARPNRLYIYKKWKCVEMLTVTRMHVDSQKRSCHIGYINHTSSLLNITHNQSSRGGRKFTLIRIARCNGWAG